MKNLKILAVCLLSIVTFSCDDSNDDPLIEQTGKWRLTNVSGGLAGIDQDFTGETITWEFNAETSTVTVINNNTNDAVYDGPDSGIYPYDFVTSASPEICPEVIEVDDIDFGCVTQTQSNLILNNNYADGFTFTFEYMPPMQTN